MPTPSRAVPLARKFVWPLRAPKVDPSRSESCSQLFQNPQNPQRALPVHDVIHILWSWDFYFDFCERHILPARALTPALTNPCAEPKVSQPNLTQRQDI